MKAKEILSITAALICAFACVLFIIGAMPFQMAEEALNAAAEPSVLMGFSFDATKVQDQILNCKTIWDNYHPELLTGSVDPETAVKALYEEMEAEGLNDIIAEAQAQIDAFLGK